MTQQEKQLLLKDLTARLPYSIIVNFTLGDISFNERVSSVDINENDVQVYAKYGFMKFPLEGDQEIGLSQVKPYLRPMSSMTEKEKLSYYNLLENLHFADGSFYSPDIKDWLDERFFDYRGLIEKGLALEAPENMYKTE